MKRFIALLLGLLALASVPAKAIEPEQARSQIALSALELGLRKGSVIRALGFSLYEQAIAPERLDALSQKIIALFPGSFQVQDAKQAGAITPMLGGDGDIFARQWQALTGVDVDALALFEITKASGNAIEVTVKLSNASADQRNVGQILIPFDRSETVLNLGAVAKAQSSAIVSKLNGHDGLVVLPVASGIELSAACSNTIRQSYLAGFSKALEKSLVADDVTLRRGELTTLETGEVGVELRADLAPANEGDAPSFSLVVSIEDLNYFSPPASVFAPPTCFASIKVQTDRGSQAMAKSGNSTSASQPATACTLQIRNMERVFKIGDDLRFQIQPSCDCWPILVDYTDSQGTQVIGPDTLVHRLAFEQPFVPAGTTVNVPYSNEPYDGVTQATYDFRLTIEPPRRTNTLGVVCAQSEADAINFNPAGLKKVSTSRGFGAALKRVSSGPAPKYFSAKRIYYVE